MKYGSTAVSSRRPLEILLPAMLQDEGSKLIRGEVDVWICAMGADESAQTWNCVVFRTLETVVEPMNSENIVEDVSNI